MNEVESLIARLRLAPLPGEGGWFRQTWVSPVRRADGRPEGSAIYYLMTADGFSALHRLRSAEVWHFYAGAPVEMLLLDSADADKGKAAAGRIVRLGPGAVAAEEPQVPVPAGVWQGARPVVRAGIAADRAWSLVGCSLVPGWDERDFELGRRGALLRDFPTWAEAIRGLTRG
jgi:uncharacterized protein